MIEGIWQEIWRRIENDPDRLYQPGFFSDPSGKTELWEEAIPEVGFLDECGTRCCLAGHAIMIAKEKGYELDIDDCTFTELAQPFLGDRDLTEIFFCMDERVVRHYIECRAKGVWGDS